MKLTNVDIDIILYLDYRQSNELGDANVLEISDAKDRITPLELLGSIQALESYGIIRREGGKWSRFYLNKTRQLSRRELNKQFKERRLVVLKRDGRACALCGRQGNCVHHIDYNHDNNSFDNLITLCVHCHGRVGGGNKREWQKRLRGILCKKRHVKKY